MQRTVRTIVYLLQLPPWRVLLSNGNLCEQQIGTGNRTRTTKGQLRKSFSQFTRARASERANDDHCAPIALHELHSDAAIASAVDDDDSTLLGSQH